MTDYTRKKEAGERFSLHDAHIIAMDFDYDSGELRLVPQYGFADIAADGMVEGEVVITGVSTEDSYISLMEYKNVLAGNVGGFVGEKSDPGDLLRRLPFEIQGHGHHEYLPRL